MGITRDGLWIGQSWHQELDSKSGSGMLEMFTDHLIGYYQRLLDLFQATVSAHRAESSTLEKLQQAWKVYLRSADRVQAVMTVARAASDTVNVVHVAAPNTAGMRRVLQEGLELDDMELDLLETEMLRLVWWYGATEIDWSIFAIAAYHLFFSPDETERKWRRACARWRKTFSQFDLDHDEFLDRVEFEGLCQDEVSWSCCSQHRGLPRSSGSAVQAT